MRIKVANPAIITKNVDMMKGLSDYVSVNIRIFETLLQTLIILLHKKSFGNPEGLFCALTYCFDNFTSYNTRFSRYCGTKYLVPHIFTTTL
jgi:hypothetical protein